MNIESLHDGTRGLSPLHLVHLLRASKRLPNLRHRDPAIHLRQPRPHRPGSRLGQGVQREKSAFDDFGIGQKLVRQLQFVDGLAKAPDRAVVGRLAIERNAAKPSERQPVAHRFGLYTPLPRRGRKDITIAGAALF